MAALKMGKHVYVEKPLTLTISEARALHAAAKKAGVCTQMGNTGHASEGSRLTNEAIQSGSIGEVGEVHCRTNRPIWPQDLVRPAGEPVPDTLNWDLWLGPAADKPYSGQIAPFKWRGFIDYGTGALGDMGAHIIDHPMWALKLGLPTKVWVEKADRAVPGAEKDSHPSSCIIHYEFAAADGRGPVKLTWFDGKYTIPRPAGMRDDQKVPDNGGTFARALRRVDRGDPEGRSLTRQVELRRRRAAHRNAPPRGHRLTPGCRHRADLESRDAQDRQRNRRQTRAAQLPRRLEPLIGVCDGWGENGPPSIEEGAAYGIHIKHGKGSGMAFSVSGHVSGGDSMVSVPLG